MMPPQLLYYPVYKKSLLGVNPLYLQAPLKKSPPHIVSWDIVAINS